jgi:hypothetical protein
MQFSLALYFFLNTDRRALELRLGWALTLSERYRGASIRDGAFGDRQVLPPGSLRKERNTSVAPINWQGLRVAPDDVWLRHAVTGIAGKIMAVKACVQSTGIKWSAPPSRARCAHGALVSKGVLVTGTVMSRSIGHDRSNKSHEKLEQEQSIPGHDRS